METGAAVVCPSVARCVGVGVRWQLVVEEEGAGVENGLEYDALAELGQTGVTSPTQGGISQMQNSSTPEA